MEDLFKPSTYFRTGGPAAGIVDEQEASKEDSKEPVDDVEAHVILDNKCCKDSMSFNKTWWQIGDSEKELVPSNQ